MLKRLFDIIFSIFAILLTSPIMLIIIILIKIKSPNSKIFFTQERLGLNGVTFKVFKFTTMIPNAENILKNWLEIHPEIKEEYLKYRKLKDDPRIIKGIGNFLRKSSLDELPQFFNVLKGDMSVVGPRPYIENEFHKHEDYHIKEILSVKPGVTGYWQVNDRNHSTFNERVDTDLEYIQIRNFILDIKIIFKTIMMIVNRKRAY
jgi:undecaprenyl-phosphate galactose phosphotransferase